MKSSKWVRAIAYGAVASLAVVAIKFTKPLPASATRPAAEVLSDAQAEDLWRERYDTLRRGETLISVLGRGGISELLARKALQTATMIDLRRIPVGMQVHTRSAQDDTIPTEIILKLAVDRRLRLVRADTAWTAEEQLLPWQTDTVVITGVIRTHLYAAMEAAARDLFGTFERERATWRLADIFEYRVDMSRDLRVGDSFRLIAERKVGPEGVVKFDGIIGATMRLSGNTIEAVRFQSARVGGDYFDANGQSMRAGFLRTPVQFRRISSGFGMRRHPILGGIRKHQGLDYAASSGTPVRAVGDGVVIRASYHSGYGNVIDIRHPNGFVTRYGHMRGFAQGVRAGTRVAKEQTIGYVGSTGLSTAPHLHFEVLVNGQARNPREALANASSDPIPGAERVAFAAARARVLALLESSAYLASVETANGTGVRGAQQ